MTILGDVDWTFPESPSVVFCKDKNHQKTLNELLLNLFYNQNTPQALKAESEKGSLEVWLVVDNTRFYIRRDFIKLGNEFVQSLTLMSDVGTGQNVSLPENLTLGDYLFRCNIRAFCKSVIVNWPEINESDHLNLRVNNIRQGGDEEFSLIKLQNSLAGAQMRVSKQKGSMVVAKAEYDALRREWETAYRQQDEKRLLLIELKNLQETEDILSEKIATALIIQERLALLTQNPDYRELRQLQEELIQLEDRICAIESNLTTLTNESEIDWEVIENLREECLEWASLQEQVERLTTVIQMAVMKITELKDALQTCGYDGSSKYEDQRLNRFEEERQGAQKELNKLPIIKNDLESTQLIYSEELARLRGFADMTGVTEADILELSQRETHLKQWNSSKIACSLDRILQKYFNGTSIGKKLESRLNQYYESNHAANFEEFTNRLMNYRDQQKRVEKIENQIERLQETVGREDKLCRTVQTRSELLKQAFLAVKVADLPAWLNGWEDYERKQHQLFFKLDELNLLQEQSSIVEKKLQTCAEQLREKLWDWDTPFTDRDEVIVAVFKVASQLRAKDEAKREIVEYSKRFKDLLGARNMEQLAQILEPLADLERETLVSYDERQTELTGWEIERRETRRQYTDAEQRLQHCQRPPSLTIIEKKIEAAKRQWLAYSNLPLVINDTQIVLETSWQEWQAKFGKALNNEMKCILNKISSSLVQETIQRDLAEAKRDYFAYRMAIAHLTLGSYTEKPLFFSVGAIDEDESFWIDVIEHLCKLSLTRQMILITTDPKLREKLTGIGWYLQEIDNYKHG